MRSLLVLLFCLFAVGADGTTLLYKNFDDLVMEADAIVEASVEDVVSLKHESEVIYTYVTLTNLEIIKGIYKADRLTLLLEGGFVDGQGLHVAGSPILRKGEQTIAFIKGNGQQIVPLVGWEQGLFRVIDDPRTGERVISDSAGNPVFGIEKGCIVTETRRSAPPMLLGLPALQSEPSSASPGLPGEAGVEQWVVRQEAPGVNFVTRSIITREMFVQEIGNVLAIQEPVAAQPLTSARIGDRIERRDQTYVRPSQAEEPPKLRRYQETRGQPPTRIVPGTD